MSNTYSNRDFYLSAFLVAEGHELSNYYRENGFTTFIFEENDRLLEAVRKFHSLTAVIEPNRYGHAIKSLKTLIHSEQISTSKLHNYHANTQKGAK